MANLQGYGSHQHQWHTRRLSDLLPIYARPTGLICNCGQIVGTAWAFGYMDPRGGALSRFSETLVAVTPVLDVDDFRGAGRASLKFCQFPRRRVKPL